MPEEGREKGSAAQHALISSAAAAAAFRLVAG
jgi:hypothetical protein